MQYYDQEFPYNTTKRLQSILERIQKLVNIEQKLTEAIKDAPAIPEKFTPVLAKISKCGELGNESWWEVVYHDGVDWQHFAGSNTFDDGEKVVRWRLCRECLFNGDAKA